MAVIKHYNGLNTDLKNLFKEISDFLDGPEPPEGKECYLCKYRNKLKPAGKVQDSLPF